MLGQTMCIYTDARPAYILVDVHLQLYADFCLFALRSGLHWLTCTDVHIYIYIPFLYIYIYIETYMYIHAHTLTVSPLFACPCFCWSRHSLTALSACPSSSHSGL